MARIYSDKPFPLRFIIFASVLVILPASWLNPVQLLIFSAIRPFTKAAAPAADSPEAKIKRLESENAILLQENRELRSRLTSIDKLSETQSSALQIKENYNIIIASVVLDDSSSWHKSILVNRGKADEIEEGMVVVSDKYLVGRISQVGPGFSRVKLLTDPEFRAKAMCFLPPGEKPPEPKEPQTALPTSGLGVLEGWSTNQCRMKWVAHNVPAKPGWLVMSSADVSLTTSGIPKGLLIGRVTAVQEEGYLWLLAVEPAVNPYSLTSVLILKPKQAKK